MDFIIKLHYFGVVFGVLKLWKLFEIPNIELIYAIEIVLKFTIHHCDIDMKRPEILFLGQFY